MLDQSMTLENGPRHSDVGCIDHPAIVRRRALAGSDGGIVGLTTAAALVTSASDGGRIDHGQLRGVNALLAVEPHRQRDATRSRETGFIGVAGIGAIDATQVVDARGGHDGVHHRVPAVAGIDLVVASLSPIAADGIRIDAA